MSPNYLNRLHITTAYKHSTPLNWQKKGSERFLRRYLPFVNCARIVSQRFQVSAERKLRRTMISDSPLPFFCCSRPIFHATKTIVYERLFGHLFSKSNSQFIACQGMLIKSNSNTLNWARKNRANIWYYSSDWPRLIFNRSERLKTSKP